MWKRFGVVIGVFSLALIFILVGVMVYFSYIYINKTVQEGNAYSFFIGSSKREVLSQAMQYFKDEKVLLVTTLDNESIPFGADAGLQTYENNLLEHEDNWEFHYQNEYFIDYIRLSFEDGILVTIQRRRQWFELP